MDCSTPGFPVFHCLSEFAQFRYIASVMLYNHFILCFPLLFWPSVFPSIRVFFNKSAFYISWPKYWSFSISPSNEYLGLIYLRMDCFGLFCPRDSWESSLAPQFKSIHSSALNPLYGPAVTFVHDCWKNHSFDYMELCQQSDVSAFDTLSRFFIAFLSRSKKVSFNFMAAVTVHCDFGAQEEKICHCFYFFPFYLPWSDGTGCHSLSFLNVEF